MSSASRKASSKSEVLILGNCPESRWTSLLLSHAFHRFGCPAPVVWLEDPGDSQMAKWSPPEVIPLHIGNGEIVEKAFLVFGEAMADSLWRFSHANYRRASQCFADFGLPLSETGLAWFATDTRERDLLEASVRRGYGGNYLGSGPQLQLGGVQFLGKLTEPACQLDVTGLESCLLQWAQTHGGLPQRWERLVQLEKSDALNYRLTLERAGRLQEKTASVILCLANDWDAQLFPWLKDKLIPITLSSFSVPKSIPLDFGVAHFHGGADFGVITDKEFRLGSFRNLYQDRGVGRQRQVDPLSLVNLERFFADLKWTGPSQGNYRSHLSWESITCDGLPIAGALPDLPGVYWISGFAGRAQNFIFELVQRLAEAIVRGKSFEPIELFSTKRFL